MKRVIIIGSGGAGKSTLARRMGEILGLEVLHLDSLFWKPGWVQPLKAEWEHTVEQLVSRESYIMDGNFGSTLDMRLKAADTVIYLDFPRLLCLYRVIKRWIKYRNKSRPDMTAGCPEKLDLEFLGWVWGFRRKTRPRILDKLAACSKDKEVHILKNPGEVVRFLDGLTAAELTGKGII